MDLVIEGDQVSLKAGHALHICILMFNRSAEVQTVGYLISADFLFIYLFISNKGT